MLQTKKIQNAFLENINIVNTATNFFNSNKDISDMNTLYNKTTNYFSPYNTNNNYKSNTLNINNIESLNLNSKKKFGWKDIMNLDYNKYNNNENILEDPLIKNILNSDINENEIQNIPENYIVNLIHTLQGLANNAIRNNNYLESENKKLYQDLETMKTNNEYLHQKNIKINQKLIDLNKKNSEQKNIQNIIYDNTYIKKKRYYCNICTNKKFKTQKYLDEHISRRHPDYPNDIMKLKENKEKRLSVSLYQKKINEMKNYFDNLIYKSMKKIQYIKLNEKLNNLQNLLEMKKNINNIIMNNNNNNYQEEINIEYNNDNDDNDNNEDNNSNEKINDNKNTIKSEEKEKKSETENSASLEKSEDTNKRKQNEILEKKHGNFIHNYLLLKKEIKFIAIKKFFEPKPEDEQITHQRSKKKTKTLKMKNKSKLAEIDSTDEQKKEETKKLEFTEEKKEEKENLKTKNENNIEKKELEEEEKEKDKEEKNKLNEDKEEENIKSSKKKLEIKEENMINFSEEEEEEENNQLLKQFCKDFKNRDNELCQPDEKLYLKNALPKGYKPDKKKVNIILKEKIDSKLKKINFEEKTINQIRTEMMRIYYETFDIKEKYGDMYLFSYLNLSNLMNLKDLIVDANNNNFYLEDNFFETVKYKLQDQDNSEFFYNGDEQYENRESRSFSFANNNND